VHVARGRTEASLAVRELLVRDHGADRHETAFAVESHARFRGHPQPGLPRDAEDRLVLQFGEGEVVGNLTEYLGKRSVQGAADGGEQLGGGFLLSPLDLRQVAQGNARRGRNLAQRATLPQAQPT
jgi:hypothetical protein